MTAVGYSDTVEYGVPNWPKLFFPGSIPLSEVGPFRGRHPRATSRLFPPRSPLHPRCSVRRTQNGINAVLSYNGYACAPGLARPPSPAVLPSEPSLGVGGGPWVRVPFTRYHTNALARRGPLDGSAPYPSTLLAGGISLLTSSTLGLCPPIKLLEASGPIPAP